MKNKPLEVKKAESNPKAQVPKSNVKPWGQRHRADIKKACMAEVSR